MESDCSATKYLRAGQQLPSFGQRHPKWARGEFTFDHCQANRRGFAEIVDQAGLDNHLHGSLRANVRFILRRLPRMCAPALARSRTARGHVVSVADHIAKAAGFDALAPESDMSDIPVSDKPAPGAGLPPRAA